LIFSAAKKVKYLTPFKARFLARL